MGGTVEVASSFFRVNATKYPLTAISSWRVGRIDGSILPGILLTFLGAIIAGAALFGFFEGYTAFFLSFGIVGILFGIGRLCAVKTLYVLYITINSGELKAIASRSAGEINEIEAQLSAAMAKKS